MIRALLALLARLAGRVYCRYCQRRNDATHCDGCHNAPAYCMCAPDLVPDACGACGYPIEYCPCGHGYDLSDYVDYVKASR